MWSEGNRIPLSDNLQVEKALGEKNILCLDDLVNEIYTVGTYFKDAVEVLAPFRLSSPLSNFEKKVLCKTDKHEGKGGYVGDEMNELLAKIL